MPRRAPPLARALGLAAFLLPAAAGAQGADPLAPFVDEALARNLGLAERRQAVARRDAAVREARGRWLPALTLDARYSEPFGNVLDFGRIVNPIYGALNQLVDGAPFPTDLDLQLPLRQETRLRLAQPLYQPAIGAGVAASRALRGAEEAGWSAQARAVAAGVRLAYLDVAGATRVVELYDATLPLVRENARVTARLVEAGRATPDVVLRAGAELRRVEQERLEADERRRAAVRAFNLLLDRPLDAPLALVADSALAPADSIPLTDALRSARERREELRQLTLGADASRALERAARAAFLPALNAAVDYGYQGQDYRFGLDRDFALASLALQWNLFNGGQDAARREQAAAETARLRAQRRDVERRIELEVAQAHSGERTAREAIAAADARLAAAERSFRLVERRFAEGAAPLVEFTDARAAYTSAGLNRILTTYTWLARRVALERAAALYPVVVPPSR